MRNIMSRPLAVSCSIAAAALLTVCSAAFAQPVPKPAAKPIPSSTAPQGYSVVLVLGDMQANSGNDGNVPAAARKALADMKDFLPYKSYRLLDAQWTLGSQKTISRLRGPSDQEYQLTLRGVPVGPKLNVAFRLAEGGASTVIAASGDNQQLAARLAQLQDALREAQAAAAKARDAGGDKDKNAEASAAAKERVANMAREIGRLEQEVSMKDARGTHAIIDTSFTMDVGETVVVGTSRVAGDKALIALLTAVAHAGK
jgi:hypothetical protein